jgi:formate dehydrogenase beta subunit
MQNPKMSPEAPRWRRQGRAGAALPQGPPGRSGGHREEIRDLLRGQTLRRDLLIEFLHLIQDKWGHISAARLAALAAEMRLPQAEVYEVATFYHHFDVVKETETRRPR